MTAVPEDGAPSTNHSSQVDERTDCDGRVREWQEEKDYPIVLENSRPSSVKVLAATLKIPSVLPSAYLMKINVAHIRCKACTLIEQMRIIDIHLKLFRICIVSICTVCTGHPVNWDRKVEYGCYCCETYDKEASDLWFQLHAFLDLF